MGHISNVYTHDHPCCHVTFAKSAYKLAQYNRFFKTVLKGQKKFKIKGAVSRNSAKLGNYKISVTQQKQQMPRMGKTEED